MSKQTDFINAIAPLARAEYLNRSKWVLPSVCIAQAALESGWNVNAKTVFGIKGSGNSLSTVEYINGKYVNTTASFKAYPSLAAAVHGYYDLITGASRYKAAVNNSNAYSTISAIKAAGYATDPSYVNKVYSIITAYGLTKYDSRINTTTTSSTTAKTNTTSSTSSYVVGKNYTVVAKSGLNVRRGAGTRYKKIKAYTYGTVFTCKEVKTVGNQIWCRTPSGWVCVKNGNEVYAK